jgi:hypothetical protein
LFIPAVKEEITPDQIKQADAFADKQLAPIDVDLTSKHVFDRLTGRDSDVTLAQLIGFFKRLGQNKKEFFDFFKKYKEIVATDKRTDLNIPFLNMTNKAIAKTIMRKDNFMSSSPKLVFEVGEANLKPYKWKEVDVDGWVTYVEFTTESETEYSVDIATVPYFDNDLNNYKALEIEFLAKPKDAQGSSAKIIVNKGELYRVMATITDIIKYYVKKFKAKAISYSPSKKSDEEDFGSQRDNLYRAFISKAIPGVRFEKNSNFITAILPDKTLNEGKQVGILYHYTSADGLKGILSSNSIKASEEIYMGQNLYYISFTRNKNFHKKGSKFGVKTEYRITLDGDKLSNKYKITPHAYKPGYDYTENWEYDWLEDEPENVVRDFFDATGEYDEQEERISFKGPEGGIDNIKNYILAVDKVEDLQENNLPRLNEGRYDSITNKLSKLAFAAFKDIHDRGDKKGTFSFIVGPKSEYEEEQPDIQSDEFEFDFNGIVVITKDLYVVDGGANAGFDNEGDEIQPVIELKFKIPKNPDWQKVSFDIKDVVRHELEHLTQDGLNLKGYVGIDDPRAQKDPKLTRLGKYMEDDQFIRDMIDSDSLPKVNYFRLEKEVDAMLQGMYFKAKKSRTPFKDVINDYFEKVGLEGEDKQSILDLWTKRLKALNLPPIKEASNPQAGTALPYGSGFAPVKENDLFGLNKLVETFVKEAFEEDWNLQDGMLSLTKYMMDNGMNIKPLPKIKVIKDDKENASNLLGKTAYYNPADKSITLFTMDRHPKDVLRSFAHEMVHHEQNLEGRLNNINTTNTNEDGDLPEIEKEAYEKGNMMLRNWEDNIKNV